MAQFVDYGHVEKHSFDTTVFLAYAGPGRRIVHFDSKSSLFSQGDSADSVFYLQEGRAKLTVVSQNGKEAIIRFSPLATSLERGRLRLRLDCAWQQPLQ